MLILRILDSSLIKLKLKNNSQTINLIVANRVMTNANITLNNGRKQQVNVFYYLRNSITDANKGTREIRKLIALIN